VQASQDYDFVLLLNVEEGIGEATEYDSSDVPSHLLVELWSLADEGQHVEVGTIEGAIEAKGAV
jgi:hypothetical protein